MSLLAEGFGQINSAVNDRFDQTQLLEWICKYTKINGRPFSFDKHEYQERILRSDAPEQVIRKCSQVGISEVSARKVLALADIMRYFNSIYTLPTHTAASKFTGERVDPVIAESPRLSAKLSKSVNSKQTKQIGMNFIHFSGTFGANAAISIPADMLFHDEVDFSDQEVLEKFNSRLTHSDYKWKMSLSTPTVGGFGIDALFTTSRRHFNFCKCSHCGRMFLPDYLKHVHVPGFDGEILSITKQDLASLDWRQSKLLCPHCGKEPDLSPKYRHWVCENPGDVGLLAEGFQVSPFDAPSVITIPYLVERSSQYQLKTDFINFNLGLPSSDESSGLQASDVQKMVQAGDSGAAGYSYIGVDMGGICHIVVLTGQSESKLVVTERYAVESYILEPVLAALVDRLHPLAIVLDAMPYTTEVYRYQQRWDNVYGAMYISSTRLESFTVADRVEDEEKSQTDLRQVNVNRDYAFDTLMVDIRSGAIGLHESVSAVKLHDRVVYSDTDTDLFASHLREMKRVREEKKTTSRYRWVKPPHAVDHYHHALLYAYIASQLTGVKDSRRGGLGPMFSSFRLK